MILTETQLPYVVDGLQSLKLMETSFSDAETQAPAGFIYGLPLALNEPSFSDAETQWLTDFEGRILRFQSLVGERYKESDTDCSSHSVSLIKFKKMKQSGAILCVHFIFITFKKIMFCKIQAIGHVISFKFQTYEYLFQWLLL